MWAVFGLLVLVAVVGVVAAWLLPPVLVQEAADGGKLPTAVRVAEVSSARQSILFAAGGSIALITLGFTWRRDQTARQVAEVQRDSQFTERYTSAVDQLGRGDSLAVRLGGIGALERLARESPIDRAYITQLLSRWIRAQTAIDNGYVIDDRPHERLDLRAAVEAYISLARHSPRAADALQGADLRGVDFRGLDLSGIDLSDADLRSAQFLDANLTGANLQRARMDDSTFGGTAVLNEADLRRASLRRAAMSGASFLGADLANADFTDADLSATLLGGATSIRGTVFRRTKLGDGSLPQPDKTTVFDGAFLEGTIFTGDLTDVDLSAARIDLADFSRTKNTHLAKLPTELGPLYARNWPQEWQPEGYWPDA
ncbi:pentapeptide repeat-containing protein [Microbacterium sp. WCS2018Hpa-23]|uniref:pentapeptide repeat-containing protein n=1 Tax=Microbacterium sp. WCS2018Hpa-23 TaxID=3073634 RepID=UPI0028833AC0|nr:pentapeptide repeat-containing protein [Microbacterium sp. WCS2018Hpa-23]